MESRFGQIIKKKRLMTAILFGVVLIIFVGFKMYTSIDSSLTDREYLAKYKTELYDVTDKAEKNELKEVGFEYRGSPGSVRLKLPFKYIRLSRHGYVIVQKKNEITTILFVRREDIFREHKTGLLYRSNDMPADETDFYNASAHPYRLTNCWFSSEFAT